MNNQGRSKRKSRIRLLKFCAAAPVQVVPPGAKDCDAIQLQRGSLRFKVKHRQEFDALVADGLIIGDSQGWKLCKAGKMHLKRLMSEIDEFQKDRKSVV